MTESKVILAVNSGDGKTRLLTADAGRTVKIKLIAGNKYLLKNVNDDFAPENITLQRVGKALHIIQEGDTQPSIIIENYFDGDKNNPTLMGMAEDGLLYAYIPVSGESYDTGYLIADGSMSPVALGGDPLGAGGPILTAPDDDNDMLFGMLGWFALAAAGVGAAFALAEMDDEDGDKHATPEKPSIGQTIDDEGSIKGPLKSGDVTDDTKPSLTGKGNPGDTIHIIDNDKEIGSVIVDDGGEWSYTPDKPLNDGEHDLSVVVEDPDGNKSPPSDPITIVVDTVAPDAPTIEHIMDKVGKVTGEIQEDAYTDDPKPEMSGTGEAGATITIYDNGKKIGETTVNDDGRWYFRPSENLADGSHSITVSQTDKAGNVSKPSDEREFIVLTEPPGKAETPEVNDNTGPVTGPLKPGDVTDDSKPSFSGEGTPGNTIVIKDNDKEIGSVIVDDEGKWTYTPENDLSEGEHNVEVIEEDPLGNVGEPSDPIQIIVDTTPPAKPDMVDAEDNTGPITGQLKGGDVTDETRPVFSGKGEPGDTVTIYDGDEVLGSTVIDDEGNWTLTPEKPLGEGDHSITVTQTDKAGNTSDPSEALEFEVDTTAPDASANVLKITAVADDVGDRQGNVASGEITDDSKPLISGIGEAGNTVFVYSTDSSGKHLIGSAVVGSDGTWSLTPSTPLTEGLNKLTLETQDPAGNRVAGDAPSYDINLLIPVSTNPSINSVVDNSEPHVGPLQKGESTNDTTPTLSGSAAPGDIVSILDNGKVIGSVTADSNGKWTFTPDTALADGKHTFTVTATDAAGNARTSGSFPIVIDTTAPAPADNIILDDNVGDKQGPVGEGDTTDDQSPTLSGEAEPGSVVDIYDNDEKIGSVIVDDEGKWTYTPDKPLDKGDHELTTTVTDPSGNTSEPSPGISFTVDPDPNQVTVGEVVDDQGPIVGNLKPGNVTDDVRPELGGKGKPGSIVTIKDGDDVLGSTVVDPDGNWTFTPEQDLADGDHSLTVVSKDPAGNEVTSPSFDITVDATAPEKPVLGSATDDVGTIRGDLSNGSTTDDANPTFNGSAEPGSRVDIYDNGEHIGSTVADDKGAWQFTPTTPLPEGEHHITTTATDEAGNTSPESDDFVLVTDYTPPAATSDVLNITSVMDDVGGRQGNIASGEVTDDSKPVINGIGEAGSTVFVYSTDANGKHLLGSAVVDSEGNWTLALDTPLVEGLNQLTLETQDAVGNRVAGEAPSYDITVLIPVSTEPSINSVVDNSEPHVGPLQKGDSTNDTTPTLSGSAAPGDIVSILDNGKVIGSVTADSNGKWTFTPDTALADGKHTFTVTATDAAGNARTSGSFPIVIDTTAPAPADNIILDDNVGDKQGPVGEGDTTDDQSPTLSGEAEPGSVVDIYDNDEKIGSVIVDDEGKWTYTPDKPLDKGDHELTTTVTDPSGNTSEPSPGISFTVDPDPNQVTVGEVVDDQGPIVGNLKPGTVTDDARPELGGKGKPGSTVTIKDGDDVLGSTVVDPDGNWTFTPDQDLAEGDHSLTVVSKDPAGNDVTSPAFDITVDTVAPEKPVVGLATDDVGSSRGDLSSGSTTDDANPTFKGSAEPGSRVDIYDNGELIGSTVVDENGGWQFTPTTALPEGEHHITTTATDEAGNTSPESDDFVLITDYTAPDASKVVITEVYDDVKATGVVASGGETDDNRPLIKGTGAEPGNTITVYNGDKVIGTAKVQADGTWSLEPTTPLPDGKYTLTAKETDGVGNVSGPSAEYVINVATVPPQAPTLDTVYDDVAPHADYLQKGDVTNDTTPTLSGSSGVIGGTISIYDNGRLIGTATVGSNGSWSFTPDTALADGNHSFTATVTDGVGRTSEPTGGFGIVVDTKAPDAASDLLVTDNVGAYQGPVVSGDTTDDNTPTLSGKAEPGSTVNIIDNGQVIGSTKVNPDGTWSFTPDQALSNGEHDLTTTVTDPSGNTGPEGSHVVITVDVVPGKVEITGVTDDAGSVTGSLSQNAVTDDTRPQISGTAKAGSTVTIMDGSNVLGTTTAGADGTWSFTPSVDLGRGEHIFTATAKDPMGNESSSSSWTVTIDTDAPVKPTIDAALDDVGTVQGALSDGSSTDDPTPTLSGKAEAGSTVKIYDQNGLLGEVTAKADGTWSFSPVAKLPEGEHRFHVTATDKAGNTSQDSDDFVLTLDYTAPDASKLAITEVYDDVKASGVVASGGETDDNRPLIKGTGAEPGNTITVYNGDKVIGTAKVQADGTWELQVTKALPDGTYNLTVKETDSVGNTTAASPEYIIQIDAGGQPLPPTLSSVEDDVAPHTGPLQKDATTNDNTLLLTGTAEANVTVRIYGGPNGTTLLGETQADAQGKWSFNTPKLADGVHTFVAEAINDIGQVSPQTGGFPVTVDTSAPGEVTGFIVSDNEGPKTGVLSNGDTTDDATPTISGKAEPGSVVHVYVNGQENGTAVADANGNWTYTTGSLADGEYTFTARAEDSAGNLGAENAGVTVTLDTSSVPVTIVRVMDDKGTVTGELKANDVTDDARPDIIGKAKAGSIVTIKDGSVVLGTVTADASGNWTFTPTSDLGDGVHNITATAKDLTGKEDTSSTFSFEIDSKAPNRPSIDYAEDQVGTVKDDLNSNDVTDDPQPILHGTAEANSTVNIYSVDGTLLGSVTANSSGAWNFKPGSKLPEGKNTFYVTATDKAGNVSDKSADFVLTTDYTAPDASKVLITEVVDNYGSVTGKVESGGVLDDSRPVIKGTGAEIGNVITVYTTDANGATKVLGTTTVDANGTWTLTVSDALYADLNKLTVTETDTTGNTAKPSDSYDVTLSSAPGVPVIDGVTDDAGSANVELSNGGLTKDTTPTLHGTASGVAGNTVTIYNGNQVVGTTTLDANGNWSFTPGTALADGSYHFTVTVTNTAGQESEKSQVYSIDVDATAPNPATDILIADDVSPITGNLQDGDVTDDNKPTFSGKAEAGSTVNILDGGKVIGSTTVDSNGDWSWTPGTALVDGDHAFTTTVTDKAGNTSTPTGVVNITVDTQGSTVSLSVDGYHDDAGTNTGLILGSGTSTDDTSPVLQGSWTGDLDASDSIRVYQDGILLGLAVLDRTNHTWTMAVNGLVNANTYKFTVVAVDAAGNESTPSAEFALTIDQDAPTQTVTITSYTDDVGLATGNMPGNTSTDDRQPVLNGKVTGTPLEAGDEVRIYSVNDNSLLGTATVKSDGTWSFELPPLEDGMTHSFRAVVADNVGNEGTPSSDFAITVDLNLQVNKQDTLDTTPIVSGSTGFEIQQGEYVEVTVNGKTYSSQNGQVVVDMRNNTWYVQIPDADALNVGTYDVKAVLFDAAGVQIATDDSSNELVVSPTPKVSVGAGGGDPDQKATSVTLSEDGTWRIHSNQTMLDSTATSSSSLGDFSSTRLQSNSGTGYSSNNYVQNATFIDYNRDGMMDLFTVDSNYDDGQQMFYYNGSTYTAYQVGAFERAPQTGEFAGDANTDGSANTWSWYGGIVAIDKNGDGYVDMINGDQTPNDSAIRGGYGSQIVLNNDGTVVGMSKDGTFATDYAADSGYDPIGLDQAQPDMELSGVDINNDGIVDFVMHSQNIVSDGSRIDANGATDSSAARSTNQARLVVVNGTNNGNWKVTQIVDNVFQRGSDSDPGIGNGVAMTWGDYNGDGYLDLFLGRGSESTTSDSSAGNNAGEYASRIHFNDGNGKLLSDDGDNNGIGNPTGMYTFNDTLAGAASLALDWNHDGKMDVIELPGMESSSGGINDAAATGTINLYTNTSVNGHTSFTTSNLLTQVGKSTIGGSSTAQQVSGAIAIDVDWDGDRDLLAFTSGGTTTYIENKNEVSHGTSIHLRILDEGGINTLFGNTVQLIDEATGQVVSTQVINAQSGNQTNDSTAIVDFYNLDATKSYSAVILRSAGGAVSNVGGVATADGKAVQNVNKAWGGLTAAEGNHAYVLTTESESNVANASATGGTNTTGIVGTGYNDTFFATLGNDLYNGAGGTETFSGVKSWNNTGGLDIVDYKLAGSTPLNIDLNKTGMQNTGFGSAQFINVEGLAGGSGNDTFTGNAANNSFEGRAGADTFYLDNDGKGGGQDTLKYQVQANGKTNGTGGNGSDVVHGFVVGTVEATRKADVIDISSLLVGYAGDADGAAHYINGVATIDAGDAIAQYLSVTYNGKDTILSIDRDGSGSGFGANQVLTIADTKVDLETLLANHQLVIKGPDVSTMNYSALNEGVTVNMWTGFTSAGGELEDIVKIVGTQTDDTITDNSFSNVIAGEGGNDTFYLMNGGNDVLMYNVLEGMENDATGGNGHDTVHGFKVGNVEKDGDADTLNLSDLVDYSGPVTFFENNGKVELDAASKGLEDYLKVDVVGNDTVISVDIDGQGGQHGFTQVVTLADVQTDLVTLLQNNQIMM